MTKKKKEKLITKRKMCNIAIAAALVFFGAFTTGQITYEAVIAAFIAAIIIFLTQVRDALSVTSPKINLFNIL